MGRLACSSARRGLQARYASIDPKDWIGESVALRDQVYPDGDRLSYDHIFQHKDACAPPKLRQRIAAISIRPVKPCQLPAHPKKSPH